MHAMGGREGVIDTACKTSETGYIQRRLVKSMETLKLTYDGTIRNANSDIIQFLYGEDGMDGLWIEDQTLDLMTYDNKKLTATFKHDYNNDEYGVTPYAWLKPEVLNIIKGDREKQLKLDAEWDKLKELKEIICQQVFPDGDSKQHMPVNVSRLIGRAKMRSKLEDRANQSEKYTPWEVVDMVNKLMEELEVTRAIAEGDTIGREVEDNAKIILNAHIRCALGSKKILEHDGLTKQSFDWLRGEIKQRFMKSCAFPGETVGVLAAQSVGEPATQMTLNTFHFAGVGAKNVTLGVPRLKELINVAKVVKTPSLAVFLTGDLGKAQERAKDVQSMLEHSTLQKVTSFTQIFWDPDPVNTRVREDKEWVTEYYELPDEDDNPDRCGAWLLRIQLSNKVMTDKKLTVREVGERIQNDFLGDIDCIFTDDNAEELVLRIRLLKEVQDMNQPAQPFNPHDESDDKDFKFLRSIEANILKEMTLKGILGIKKVFMREETVAAYSENLGKFDRHKEWVLDTDGVNMEEVMLLPEVDFKRLQSNDIVEILNVLGIEATRKALLFHVRMVISFDGSYVNYRHLGTMCDVMTNRGHLMAITRHGINRTNMGPLMKCSFEETVEILMDAAIYNEVDNMLAVSENVIFGQLCPIGTGSFDVFMDDQKKGDGDDIAECALDRATPVLPQSQKRDLFSMASPLLGSPAAEAFDAEDTPVYGDGGSIHHPATDGLLAEVGTVEITPDHDDEDERQRAGPARSPFSPTGDAGGRNTSPVSQASPVSPGSPLMGSPGSPMSPEHATTSPTYSPALIDDEKMDTSPEFNPLSPTYSSRSPAYTPSESTMGPRSVASRREAAPRVRSQTSGSSSPVYPAARSRKDRMGTSPAMDYGRGSKSTSPAYSPVYSPTIEAGMGYDPTSALTSPAYTPHSPGFAPTSPVYTPTSAPYLPQTSPGEVASPASEAEGALASPVIQDAEPASPGDVVTSPSYTPHQPQALGTEYGEGLGPSAFFESVRPDDSMSVLFEQSDDEGMDPSSVETPLPQLPLMEDSLGGAGGPGGGRPGPRGSGEGPLAGRSAGRGGRGAVMYSPTSPAPDEL